MIENERYLIPALIYRCEQEIEKSRFISSVCTAETENEARSFVAKIKAEFPDANHNCWAYLIGSPVDTDRAGYSDDGEPHGTAGKPMLTALRHGGVGDLVIVITRYFGGVKLGKGGMVKAYTSSVKLTLDTMPKVEKVTWAYQQVIIGYQYVSVFEQMAPSHEVVIIHRDFAENVCFQLQIPEENREKFCSDLTDATCGSVQIIEIEK